MSAAKIAITGVYDRVPSGFVYANALQAEEYCAHGAIHGVGKIVQVRAYGEGIDEHATDLAIRHHPPTSLDDIRSRLGKQAASLDGRGIVWYVKQYNAGYAAAGRPNTPRQWDDGSSSHAWDDGYLDRAAGRAKWHLTYCTDHDYCGEG